MPVQGTKTIQVSGNYLLVYDYFSEELELSLPKNYTYYTIEKRENDFSKKLFFHILGGFGGTTKTGGIDLYSPDGQFIIDSPYNDEASLNDFLRNNTGGPTVA